MEKEKWSKWLAAFKDAVTMPVKEPQNGDGFRAAGSGRRKLKEPYHTIVFLMVFLALVITSDRVYNFLGYLNNQNEVHQLATELVEYNLPEKTDKMECFYFTLSNMHYVYLLVKTDLPEEQIEGYYHKANILPVIGGRSIELTARKQQDADSTASMLEIDENMAKYAHGSIIKYCDSSPYDHYCMIILKD